MRHLVKFTVTGMSVLLAGLFSSLAAPEIAANKTPHEWGETIDGFQMASTVDHSNGLIHCWVRNNGAANLTYIVRQFGYWECVGLEVQDLPPRAGIGWSGHRKCRKSMNARLEHANLLVRDVDATIHFLQTAFPEFRIRFDARHPDGTGWLHVGTDDTYIALAQSSVEPEKRWQPYAGVPGVNHLAYEVEDVEALYQRLKSAGYQDSTPVNNHPYRKRIYFFDCDGNDWEFIQYLTDDPAKRHDYTIPDQ